MTLSKINSNLQTNQTWRGVVDAGIDQINTNTTAIASNATNIASNDTDIATNVTNIASNLTKINADLLQAATTVTVHAVNDVRVTGHHAINYTSSTALQDALDALPKNMSGHDITIQFQNGSYSFSYRINIFNFQGGFVYIKGNAGVSSQLDKGNSKNVDITFTGTTEATAGFYLNGCSNAFVQALHIKYSDSDVNAIHYTRGTVGEVRGCLIEATSGTRIGEGIVVWGQSSIAVVNNIFDNNGSGILLAGAAHVRGNNNQDRNTAFSTGDKPTYGVQVLEAGVFGNNTTSETGTIQGNTADYAASQGGLITHPNGLILQNTILTADTTVTVYAVNDVRVTGHHAINYTTSTALQDAINALPKNMSGHPITVQFQNGPYDFGTTQIYIIDFTGGIFSIVGNTNNSGTGTYNVILQGQNTSENGIFSFKQCPNITIRHIEFQATGSDQSNYLVKVQKSDAYIYRCKFSRTATGSDNSRGIYIFDNSNARILESHFSQLNYAVYAKQNSNVSVATCEDYGTKPIYGVSAVQGAIVKPMYTDIHGSLADYDTSSGGLITNTNGLILGETILTATKIVNFDNSMSVPTMQGLINDQPKNLNGYDLTFQFADGPYDFGTSALSFGQFEGGTLNIKGKANETPNAAGGGMSVIIRSQNTGNKGALFFQKCVRAVVTNIRFEQTGSNTDTILVRFYYNTYGRVQNSSFVNVNGTQNNVAVYYYESTGLVQGCKFNNFNNNVSAVVNSRVCSRNSATFSGSGSDQDSTNNIRSETGSIVTQSGTQSGGAASKYDGGIIFSTTGTVV